MRKLISYNEWWGSGTVPGRLLRRFRRRDFYKVRDNLSRDKITILIGPRRVGKTVIMRQLVDYLINEKDPKIPPKNILYAKVDDYLLKTACNSTLEVILDVYTQNVLREPIDKQKETVYVFFDEIHKIDNWKQQMMDIYEKRYDIVFLVSGSSSPAIFKDEGGVLTGRYKEQIMLPMKFVDVINLHEQKEGETTTTFNVVGLGLRKSLKNAVANELAKILAPVRKYFETNKEAKECLETVRKAKITR